jgi:hypothetical protein
MTPKLFDRIIVFWKMHLGKSLESEIVCNRAAFVRDYNIARFCKRTMIAIYSNEADFLDHVEGYRDGRGNRIAVVSLYEDHKPMGENWVKYLPLYTSQCETYIKVIDKTSK